MQTQANCLLVLNGKKHKEITAAGQLRGQIDKLCSWFWLWLCWSKFTTFKLHVKGHKFALLLKTSVFFTLCTHRMKVNFNQIFVHVNFDHAFTGLTSSGRIGQLLFRGGVLWTANDGIIILICIYRQYCSNTVKYQLLCHPSLSHTDMSCICCVSTRLHYIEIRSVFTNW